MSETSKEKRSQNPRIQIIFLSQINRRGIKFSLKHCLMYCVSWGQGHNTEAVFYPLHTLRGGFLSWHQCSFWEKTPEQPKQKTPEEKLVCLCSLSARKPAGWRVSLRQSPEVLQVPWPGDSKERLPTAQGLILQACRCLQLESEHCVAGMEPRNALTCSGLLSAKIQPQALQKDMNWVEFSYVTFNIPLKGLYICCLK